MQSILTGNPVGVLEVAGDPLKCGSRCSIDGLGWLYH